MTTSKVSIDLCFRSKVEFFRMFKRPFSCHVLCFLKNCNFTQIQKSTADLFASELGAKAGRIPSFTTMIKLLGEDKVVFSF